MTTREEAIKLAQEAGFCQMHGMSFPGNAMTPEILTEFAQLVENNALKKAAKVCSDRANNHRGGNEYREDESRNCEAVILALVKE